MMVRAFLPTLVKVVGCAAWDPRATLPKFRRAGDSSTAVPKPESVVVCGLLLSLSMTVIFPVLFPAPLGVKVTQMLHAAVQLPSVLCGFKTVPAPQYVALPVEQSAIGLQPRPVTENCGLLLAIDLIVSGVAREL